jgi:putative transcriptional regulator
MKTKNKTRKYRSRLSATIHESAPDLHRIGLIDRAMMRKFDALCVLRPKTTPPAQPTRP